MKKRQTLLYIILAIVLAAIVWLIFFILPSSDPAPVPIVLPTQTPDDSAQLSTPQPEPTEQALVVTADTVQAVLETLRRADSYSRSLTVESFWSGGSSSQTIEVAVSGGSTRLNISSGDNEPTQHILISGDEKWIWYSDSEAVYHSSAQDFESDRYQTLLSYEDILSLDRENILEASHFLYEDTMCVYVRYISGLLGYESRAYIELSSGLLLALETYDGDQLIYKMSSGAIDLSTPDESLFVPPESLS